MPAEVPELSRANFQSEVLNADRPVLVDFWADWCGPCKMMAPIVEELSREYDGKLRVARLNVDENQEIASGQGVMSIPTLILFKDGRPAGRFVGFIPKKELKLRIDRAL